MYATYLYAIDSKIVCDWIDGVSRVDSDLYKAQVAVHQNSLHKYWTQGHMCPRQPAAPHTRRSFRELSKEADELAVTAVLSAKEGELP